MSTKIYHAYRFPRSRINDFIDIGREQMFNMVADRVWLLMNHIKREAVLERAREIWQDKAEEEIKSARIERLMRFESVVNLWTSASESPYRNEITLLDCGFNIWFMGKYCYVIPIAPDWMTYNLKFPDWVQEYGYWNNTDKPDNLTRKQWRARALTWDKVCLNNHNSRRLYHEVFNGKESSNKIELQHYMIGSGEKEYSFKGYDVLSGGKGEVPFTTAIQVKSLAKENK